MSTHKAIRRLQEACWPTHGSSWNTLQTIFLNKSYPQNVFVTNENHNFRQDGFHCLCILLSFLYFMRTHYAYLFSLYSVITQVCMAQLDVIQHCSTHLKGYTPNQLGTPCLWSWRFTVRLYSVSRILICFFCFSISSSLALGKISGNSNFWSFG